MDDEQYQIDQLVERFYAHKCIVPDCDMYLEWIESDVDDYEEADVICFSTEGPFGNKGNECKTHFCMDCAMKQGLNEDLSKFPPTWWEPLARKIKDFSFYDLVDEYQTLKELDLIRKQGESDV